MEYIKAPDFPTGGIIYGYDGVREAFETGRGRIVIRGEAEIEELPGGKERIIVTSIPYLVNKAEMIKRTADLVNEKKIEGISDIRDESDRNGLRIVYELKKDALASVVLNKLYQYTYLQTAFNVNNVALVNGRPRTLNLKDLIRHFVDHRHEVVIRRTEYELKQAEKRAHVLEGLLVALDNLDEVIALIRRSNTPEEARIGLIDRFELTDIQARAILDMRLQKLTGLEREKIKEEHAELLKKIEDYKAILSDESLRMNIIKEEMAELREKYGDEPRTRIEFAAEDFRIEDTIPDDDVLITISHLGYIKRTLLNEYRRQGRGGRGAKGSETREEDFVEYLFIASNHDYLLFFTEGGKCYWKRVFEIPEGTKTSKGRAIQNLIMIDKEDKIRAFINTRDLKDEEYVRKNFIVMATRKGTIKKTSLEAYSRPRQNGINAITINEGDELLEAKLTNGNNEILMAVKTGRAIRFHESKVRPMGRNAAGVRGITLAHEKDEVVGMICVENGQYDILVVSENGYGKRSQLEDYRVTNRGGKGVKTINVTNKTGHLIAIKEVQDTDDLMIINRSGIIIRLAVSELRVMGRATQGVKLINLREDDIIASVAKVEVEDDDEIMDDIIDN
jgi:DNA gyrase subunit A